MRAIRSSLVLVVLGALVAVAAGCGRAGAGPDSSIGSQRGMDTGPAGVSCDDLGMGAGPTPSPTVTQAPLPAGFVPVAATRCLVNYETVPGDGEWITRVDQRAEGDLTAVATELRRPDETDPPNAICPLIGYLPTIITLIDATGATMVPAIPRITCGAPLASTLAAIADLPWQTVGETRVRQVRSELEMTSGCGGEFKPMIALTAAEAGRSAPVIGPVFTPAPAALRVCRYELSTDETMEAPGVTAALGVLASAASIDGPAMTAFVQALATAPAAPLCTQPAAPFAEVSRNDGTPNNGSPNDGDPNGDPASADAGNAKPSDAGPDVAGPDTAGPDTAGPDGGGASGAGGTSGSPGGGILVELGGCYRFLDQLGGLRQLDAAIVAPLQG